MRILAVIPARGGSKGIKNKNMRSLEGKPLIWYTINTAKKTSSINDIVVTSDGPNIIDYASLFEVKTRTRSKELSEDDVPLDPVVFDALKWYEEKYGEVDYVVTLQPTSPLLSAGSLSKAIELAVTNDYDTIISVVDETHLMWKMTGEIPVPQFTTRQNRQYLDRIYKETGGFVISKRKFVNQNSRFGKSTYLFELPFDESIDIDSLYDFLIAEALMSRAKILIVTFANRNVGTGHFYRTLSLADIFIGHEVDIALVDSEESFYKIAESAGFSVIRSEFESIPEISEGYDIVINDVLDTDRDYIKALKDKEVFVVNFEDLGTGSELADLVFNDMYSRYDENKNSRSGFRYAVLKESFLHQQPNGFKDNVRNVIIAFGGVDENNLTLRVIRAIEDVIAQFNLSVKVIVGLLYPYFSLLEDYVKGSPIKNNIKLVRNASDMAKEMKEMDIGLTSNGRTVYELAVMRVPIISIAQNLREETHMFARENSGVKYLGNARKLSDSKIKKAFLEIVSDKDLRKTMYFSLPHSELCNGVLRVKDEIIDSYRRNKKNGYYDRQQGSG